MGFLVILFVVNGFIALAALVVVLCKIAIEHSIETYKILKMKHEIKKNGHYSK